MDIDYLLLYVDKEIITELHKKKYILYNNKTKKIRIKFLDEQSKERKQKNTKKEHSITERKAAYSVCDRCS